MSGGGSVAAGVLHAVALLRVQRVHLGLVGGHDVHAAQRQLGREHLVLLAEGVGDGQPLRGALEALHVGAQADKLHRWTEEHSNNDEALNNCKQYTIHTHASSFAMNCMVTTPHASSFAMNCMVTTL
jgi:hypothetical protein